MGVWGCSFVAEGHVKGSPVPSTPMIGVSGPVPHHWGASTRGCLVGSPWSGLPVLGPLRGEHLGFSTVVFCYSPGPTARPRIELGVPELPAAIVRLSNGRGTVSHMAQAAQDVKVTASVPSRVEFELPVQDRDAGVSGARRTECPTAVAAARGLPLPLDIRSAIVTVCARTGRRIGPPRGS